MATTFPPPGPNAMVEHTPQNFQQNGIRPRPYTPYIFQPNFLKQQLKQQRLNHDSATGSTIGGHVENISHTPQASAQLPTSNTQLSTNLAGTIIEEMNKKKGGRKVVDWTSSCALYLQNRKFERDCDVPELMPHTSYAMEMQSVYAYRSNPISSITSKFVRSATNKMKCPVYKVVWTPDGRRLVTGSASGEFTLWNGIAFNFETILQAHDSPVRAMAWSKHDSWLITGDNQGYIKYWQLNMNNVKMYQAHKDQACRSVSFGPTDHKFATASDDGTVRVWDFMRCHEERILRGHGADVKQVAWHPMKGIIASASKDLQTPVKLWDPKTGQSLVTLHAHKGTVMDVKWNQNGNWLLSASRDHLIKLYDIRNLKQEMQVFRGHKKEAFSVSWHPIHENLFASGGSEGSILFWQVGEEKEAGCLEGAHDSLIWSLEWHPLGHVLVSGSNDHSTKFWSRSKPGDPMRDRYNLALLPQSHDESSSMTTGTSSSAESARENSIIPGMGDADVAEAEVARREQEEQKLGIPGLDWSYEEKNEFERKMMTQQDRKKAPYARPVPREFVAAWEANKEGRPAERRSPRPRDWERDRRRYRERHNDRPRDWDMGGPMRPDSGNDDERVYVDGIEVGPDFDPDRIKPGEQMRPVGPDHRVGSSELPPPPPIPFEERLPPPRSGLSPPPPPARRMSDIPPPPALGSLRDLEEKQRLRDELYAEVLRNGSEREIELLQELEEFGLPLEDGFDDIFFGSDGERMGGGPGMHPMDPFTHEPMLGDLPPRDMPPRDMPPRDMPPRDMPPRDMPHRPRGFRGGRDGDRFNPDRGRRGRGRWRSPPGRMQRSGGPPR